MPRADSHTSHDCEEASLREAEAKLPTRSSGDSSLECSLGRGPLRLGQQQKEELFRVPDEPASASGGPPVCVRDSSVLGVLSGGRYCCCKRPPGPVSTSLSSPGQLQ